MGDERTPDPALKAEALDRRNGKQTCQSHRDVAHRIIVPKKRMWGLFQNLKRFRRSPQLCWDHGCELDHIIRNDEDRIDNRKNQ